MVQVKEMRLFRIIQLEINIPTNVMDCYNTVKYETILLPWAAQRRKTGKQGDGEKKVPCASLFLGRVLVGWMDGWM